MQSGWFRNQYVKPWGQDQTVDCTCSVVKGAKPKSTSKGMFVTCANKHRFGKAKSMLNEERTTFVHGHNPDSFRSCSIVNPPPPPCKETSAVAYSSWTSQTNDAEEKPFSSTFSTLVKPPPPPKKDVPRAPTPPRISQYNKRFRTVTSSIPHARLNHEDCTSSFVKGAKPKSTSKRMFVSCGNGQYFREAKSMLNEKETILVDGHNSDGSRSSIIVNPPPPPKKKAHSVSQSSWTLPTYDAEDCRLNFTSSTLVKPPPPPQKNVLRAPTPPQVSQYNKQKKSFGHRKWH